jgi:hypothetical protein
MFESMVNVSSIVWLLTECFKERGWREGKGEGMGKIEIIKY